MNNSTKYSIDPKDWIIANGQTIKTPKHYYQELKRSYWQYPVSKNSCSVHGVFTMLANSFNVDFPLKERKTIWDIAIDQGASNEWGWRFSKAIKLVQKYCTEKGKVDFEYFTITKNQFKEYALKGYAIYGGFRGLRGSTRDKLEDGYIGDDIEDYGESLFGHAVCFTMINGEFGYVDNYPDKTKYNEVKFRNLDKLLETNYFFDTGYICARKGELVRAGYNNLSVKEVIEKLARRTKVIAKRLNLTK